MGFARGALFLLAFQSLSAQALVSLNPQGVVDSVLSKSLEAEVISIDAQDRHVEMEKALGEFDFTLSGKLGFTYDEAEDFSGFKNPIEKTLAARMGFKKKTYWGSLLEVGYRHDSQSSTLNPAVASLRHPELTLDSAYLEWRQSLWANAFGLSDRLKVSAARRAFRFSNMAKQESTESLVMDSLQRFWSTYVAQTKLKDAVAARDKYKELVAVVQKRGRFGLDKGGEYAQVMADFTAADFAVKSASYDYLDRLKGLEKLMQTTFAEDVDFQVADLVPPVPHYQPVQVTELRAFRLAQTAVENADDKSRSVNWSNKPTLDLVARVTSTGVDSRATTSYSELVAGTRPTYYVGFEFSAAIDSSTVRANDAEARLVHARERNRLESTTQDLNNRLEVLARKVEQTFHNANGSIEIEKFRSRTVKEQEVEYKQGRLPLRELLETYRRFFASQTQRVQAIGDYHMALNQMAAERDELVR